MEAAIEPHNQKPAAVWNSGGARYDDISRGIATRLSIACFVSTLNQVNVPLILPREPAGLLASSHGEAQRLRVQTLAPILSWRRAHGQRPQA